ncbi:MAG: hypothetical protein EOO77_10170 [Oxalobacteraceae bacterium]|nr:MAG: hypothetical protein EOO77_10170 [Oxalobacteraceae bacterium]
MGKKGTKGATREITDLDFPRERLRLRQLLPPLVSFTVLATLLLSLLSPFFLIAPIGYVAMVLAAATGMTVRGRNRCLMAAAPAMAVMHLAWGLGFTIAVSKRRF